MRLVLFSSLLGLIATSRKKSSLFSTLESNQKHELLSVLEEYFESSSDEDNFDIDAYYTVFGNDTPEKGDLRYEPSGMSVFPIRFPPEKCFPLLDVNVYLRDALFCAVRVSLKFLYLFLQNWIQRRDQKLLTNQSETQRSTRLMTLQMELLKK